MNAPLNLSSPADVTRILHGEIPLTRAMGLSVTSWDGTTVALAAPLEPNVNHTETAFGGSIASLAVLAGYTLLFLTFRDRQISTRILIQKSATDFRLPIDAEFSAAASCPPPAALEEFLETLKRKRRARMELTTQVMSRHMVAATHTGLYVAMLY
jgi:thioesterase domain-containing protein